MAPCNRHVTRLCGIHSISVNADIIRYDLKSLYSCGFRRLHGRRSTSRNAVLRWFV